MTNGLIASSTVQKRSRPPLNLNGDPAMKNSRVSSTQQNALQCAVWNSVKAQVMKLQSQDRQMLIVSQLSHRIAVVQRGCLQLIQCILAYIAWLNLNPSALAHADDSPSPEPEEDNQQGGHHMCRCGRDGGMQQLPSDMLYVPERLLHRA